MKGRHSTRAAAAIAMRTCRSFYADSDGAFSFVSSLRRQWRYLTTDSLARYHRRMRRTNMKYVAAALLALLVLSWMGPAFGAGAVGDAGHGHTHDSAPATGSGAGHDDEHHHPGHDLDEHSNLGHLLDHLSGTLLDVKLASLAVATCGLVRCPPLMSLLTATHIPLYRPPIVSFPA